MEEIDINCLDVYGETALMKYVEMSPCEETIKKFIDKKADLSIKNSELKTAKDLCDDDNLKHLLEVTQ